MCGGGKYRSKAEVDEWKQRDPLEITLGRVKAEDAVTKVEYDAWDAEILAQIDDEIVPFAEASPDPDPKDLMRYVFVEDDPWVRPEGGN